MKILIPSHRGNTGNYLAKRWYGGCEASVIIRRIHNPDDDCLKAIAGHECSMADRKKITADASSNSELVYSFDQMKVFTEGTCAGLAINWLSLMKANKDYKSAQNKMDDPDGETNAAALQQTYEGTGGHKAALTQAGLKMLWPDPTPSSHPHIHSGLVQPSQLVQEAAQPRLYFLRIRREGGGHAVGIVRDHVSSGDVFHYFDGNFGHFYFASPARFQKWFEEFLNLSGYAQKYTRKWEFYWLG
jgi:Yersinia/Haemophilus virulence surface antigen